MSGDKVLLLNRNAMSKELMETFSSLTPPGWQATIVNMSDGEKKIAREIQDATYLLVREGVPVSIKLIENAKRLKLIQTGGQGVGQLLVKWALGKGILVANAGGTNAIAVAEFTVLLILSCMKKLLSFNDSLREGKYGSNLSRKDLRELYDKTVGIIGFGNIGRRVAKLCYAFGANVIYYERMFIPYALRADFKAKPVSLDELLSTSDIVSLHVPALAANTALIGWEQLSKMKPTAYLINTSRGANIDENALFRALNEKKIAGAGIDVWDPEPPVQNNPLIYLPNVVATPHIAGASCENTSLSIEMMWRNVLLVAEGKEPLNRIGEF